MNYNPLHKTARSCIQHSNAHHKCEKHFEEVEHKTINNSLMRHSKLYLCLWFLCYPCLGIALTSTYCVQPKPNVTSVYNICCLKPNQDIRSWVLLHLNQWSPYEGYLSVTRSMFLPEGTPQNAYICMMGKSATGTAPQTKAIKLVIYWWILHTARK